MTALGDRLAALPRQAGAPALGVVLVLRCGEVVECATGSSARRALGLADLLTRVDPAPAVQAGSPPVDAVSPGRPVVGVLADHAVEVASPDGSLRRLGIDHLAVLLAVGRPRSRADLAASLAVPPVELDRLVADLLAVELLAEASVPAAATVDGPPEASPSPAVEAPADGRIPVLPFWATRIGPHLGAAAVVAYARVHDGGRLNERFALNPARPAPEVVEIARRTPGPVILLSSDYHWSHEANLRVADEALAANPQTIVIHGGPSVPAQDAELAEFLACRAGRHVAVHGEGELTFAEVLAALGQGPEPDLANVGDVAGASRLGHDGSVERGPERPRHDRLEDFPSPLASGELALVPTELLQRGPLPIETNRGCPYGCSFCDWGQATMSRIRYFPEERVEAEVRWLADHGIETLILADANWGIHPRDVGIARIIGRVAQETGVPRWVHASSAKNGSKRYVELLDVLLGAGVSLKATLALQTRDQATLDVIQRSNIRTAVYDELADALRARGFPLTTELMLGLPGATMASLKEDLQWCIDERVHATLIPTYVLPNAPMNDAGYRAEHRIRTEDGLIVSTASYSVEERARMDLVTVAFRCFEQLGMLRHVLRLLQWDRGHRAVDVLHDVVEAVVAAPQRHPLLDWALHHTERFVLVPQSWPAFHEEARRLVVEELGVADDSALRVALAVDGHLLPTPGRTLPDTVELEHDYVSWYRHHLAGGGPAPLASFGPGRLVVESDPDDVVGTALQERAEPTIGGTSSPLFDPGLHWETRSPLTTYPPSTPAFVGAALAGPPHPSPGEPVELRPRVSA